MVEVTTLSVFGKRKCRDPEEKLCIVKKKFLLEFSLKLKEQKNSDGYIFLQKTIFFMKILNIFIFGGNFLKINFEF